MTQIIKIPGRIESSATGNVVTGANSIIDDVKGKKQNVINSEVDAELVRLEQDKQNNLIFDNAPTEDSNNPVKSGGVYAADKALSDAIEAILLLIPSAASSLNQLADKNFVNSSISTATATPRGTYNLVSDLDLTTDATREAIAEKLGEVIDVADLNDYAFVQVPVSYDDPTEIERTERYKFNGNVWIYEYTLNTSGFTAAQWDAINSGITTALVAKLNGLPTAEALELALGAITQNIQNISAVIPTEATAQNQLADKAYVLTQILLATPSFKGQFTTLTQLEGVEEPKAGDLGIVRTKDSDGHDVFTFYQYLDDHWNDYFVLSYHPQDKPATTGWLGNYPYNGMGRVELPKNMVDGWPDNTWIYLPKNDVVYLLYSWHLQLYAVYNPTTQEGLGLDDNLVIKPENYDIADLEEIVNGHYLPFTEDGGVWTIEKPDESTITSTELNNTNIYNYNDPTHQGVNLLVQSMINQQNTIYVIQYDFTLGEDIKESLQIDTTNSFTWNTYFTYYYKAINVDAGKAITLLDDALCFSYMYVEEGETKFAVESGRTKFIETATTIYIATKEPGNFNNAYRISDYITIPENCVLKFEGGSFIGGAINGDPLIDADATTIFDNCIVDYRVNNLYVNIKWFGAKGDSVTDDTEAIKRAVLGKNGITVNFPKGRYVISDNINVCKTYQYWRGESSNGQDYKNNTYINDCEFWCVGNIDGPYVNAPKVMENISFLRHGDALGSYTGTALMLSMPYVFDTPFITNVNITGFDKALHLESCGGNVISRCKFWRNNIAIYSMQRHAGGHGHGYTTAVYFNDCWIAYNNDYAFYKDFYSNSEKKAPMVSCTTFTNCIIENNAVNHPTNHGEISHITYDELIAPAPTLGKMFFNNCYGESEHYFINAERGEFHFDGCEFKATGIEISKSDYSLTHENSSLSFINTDFPNLELVKGGADGNLAGDVLVTQIDSIIKKIGVVTDYASTNKSLSLNTRKTFINKVYNVSNIPLDENISGEEYFDLTNGIPVYTYKDSNGEGTTGMEILDALGNRASDKKVSPYGTRTYNPLRVGFLLYATDLKKPLWWDGSGYKFANGLAADVPTYGTFDNKPDSSKIYEGFCYWCRDRKIDPTDMSVITPIAPDTGGMPIYYKGIDGYGNALWVDIFGRNIS